MNIFVLNTALGLVAGGLIYCLAPWATYVLGDEFRDSVDVLRLGSLLPVLQAMQYTLGGYLAATGRQSVRAVMQLVALAAFIVAGLIFIPLYSWQGAILVSLGCDALLGLLFAIGCWVIPPRSQMPIENSNSELVTE
jgi:O-antigen/teichoic acid export membrane protein